MDEFIKDSHVRAALALADGGNEREHDRDNHEAPTIETGLLRLSQLTEAFTRAEQRSDLADEDPSLFKWGHLDVVKAIDSGSFGDVYLAFDPNLEREVALKLRGTQCSAQVVENDYIEEARRLARVRHPNVMAIHGVGIHASRVGLWCDLLVGKTLKEVVKEGGPLAESEIIMIAKALASALAAVHDAGVVHGDVKAANIMQEHNGRVVLMDFGAGRDTARENRYVSPGTPNCMAPEIFEGHLPDANSDMYALGVLIYYLFTGTYPIKAASFSEFISVHRTGGRPNLRKVIPDISRPMARVLDRLLAHDPKQRPEAEQFLHELDHIQRLPKQRARNRLFLGLFIILTVATVVSSTSYFRAVHATREAQQIGNFLQDMLTAPTPIERGRDVRVIDILDEAATTLETRLAQNPLRSARLMHTLGVTYKRLDEPDRAQPLLEKSLSLRRRHLGEHHPDSLEAAISLAEIFTKQGKYDQALTLLQQTLAVVEPKLDDQHRLKVLALTRLADVLGSIGKPAEATAAIERAVALRRGTELEESATHYLALMTQGSLYFSSGQFDRAEPINRQVLAWHLKQYGPENPISMSAQVNLASTLSNRGSFTEAIALLEEVLPITRRVMGPHHQVTLSVLTNYGACLNVVGRYQAASLVTREALMVTEIRNGPKHPNTLLVMGNLANLLRAEGCAQQAVVMQAYTLGLKTEVQGATHPDTLMTQINLAELLNETGRPEQGEALAFEAYEQLLPTLGEDHLISLEALDLVAAALVAQGHLERGITLHHFILARKRAVLGEGSPFLIYTLDRLALALGQTQHHRALQQTYLQIIHLNRALHGPNHRDTLKAQLALAELKAK